MVLERAELTSGLDVPFGRARRPIARRPDADPDEHVLGRALPEAAGAAIHPPGWTESGSIKLASSPGAAGGDPAADQLGAHVRPAVARDLARRGRRAVPARRPRRRGRRRATSSPTAISIRRSCATRSPAGARAEGVRIHQHTRVHRRSTSSRSARVRGVRTDRGDIDCEVVVNCGGMFAAEIGRLAGVRIPLVPMAHQYVVTEPIRRAASAAAADPARSRPARLLPAGGRRAADGRLRARPRAVDGDDAPVRRDPADFNAKLLARGLAAVRGDRGECAAPGAGHGRSRHPADDQRPGGVHARTTSSASARPRSPGFFVAAGSARTASPGRAGSAR